MGALRPLSRKTGKRKLAAMRTAAFFRERANRGNVRKALKILSRAGKKNPPVPGDELP